MSRVICALPAVAMVSAHSTTEQVASHYFYVGPHMLISLHNVMHIDRSCMAHIPACAKVGYAHRMAKKLSYVELAFDEPCLMR